MPRQPPEDRSAWSVTRSPTGRNNAEDEDTGVKATGRGLPFLEWIKPSGVLIDENGRAHPSQRITPTDLAQLARIHDDDHNDPAGPQRFTVRPHTAPPGPSSGDGPVTPF